MNRFCYFSPQCEKVVSACVKRVSYTFLHGGDDLMIGNIWFPYKKVLLFQLILFQLHSAQANLDQILLHLICF